MFVPRWVVISLMAAAALAGGWLLHGFAADGFSLVPSPASSAAAGTSPPLNLDVDGGDPKPVVNVNLNSHDGDADQELGGSGRRREPVAVSTMASGAVPGPRPLQLTVQSSAPDADYDEIDHDESFVSNDSRITVNGNNIVVASDGSIVFQGDNGSLNGNTGNSSAGGTIAIDNNGSSISTGTSSGRSAVRTPVPSTPAGAQTTGAPTTGTPTTTSPTTGTDVTPAPSIPGVVEQRTFAPSKAQAKPAKTAPTSATPADGGESDVHAAMPVSPPAPTPQPTPAPPTTSMLQAAAAPNDGGLSGGGALEHIPGRSVSISGYEDHSITVDGNDQIILYDDSNVFINRDGQVNANTGDTDSSGLNVVDVVDSVVRSGNSGDGEGNSDDEEEEEDEDEAAPSSALSTDRTATARPTTPRPTALVGGQGTISGRAALMTSSAPLSARGSGSVDDEDTATTAEGDDVLVIGGDGYDDLAIRSRGNGNTVVYDDSNLVIGGTGGVNAQIGDSDTGGAVVMGVRNSVIEAGCEGDLCPLYRSGYYAASGSPLDP